MRRRAPIFAVACGFGLCSTVTFAGEMAGYVVDYSGPPSTLQRGSRSLPASIGAEVEVGDIVTAPASASVTIDAGGETWSVEATKSATAPRPRGGGWLFDKWREFKEIVSWHGNAADISARTRDSYALSVPMLEGPAFKVVAGRRVLRIGLVDGRPPFRVTMTNNGSPAGSAQGSVRWIDFAVALSPGPATIVVEDATGKPLAFMGRVVGEAPGEPPLNSPFGRIAAAGALARSDGGAYAFEAVQQVARPGATRAENALRDALLIGDRP